MYLGFQQDSNRRETRYKIIENLPHLNRYAVPGRSGPNPSVPESAEIAISPMTARINAIAKTSQNRHHPSHIFGKRDDELHYITLRFFYGGLQQYNFKDNQAQNVTQCVRSVQIRLPKQMRLQFSSNTSKDGADVMSSGRVFQSLGPATANERSPTVTSRDRGMISSEEVDDWRRRLDVMSETRCSRLDGYRGAVP